MKKIWSSMANRAAALLEVKSLVTLALTGVMCAIIFGGEVNGEALALFSGVYGSVITYFFTRKAA